MSRKIGRIFSLTVCAAYEMNRGGLRERRVSLSQKICASYRKFGTFFSAVIIYWPGVFLKGAKTMPDCTDPWGDLDDFIFDKEDGGPSER